MFNSYLKPGKGVPKNEKPRNARQQFFFVAGTNLKKLFFINIINLLAFVPLAIFLLCIKNELNISEGYGYIYDILSFIIIVILGIPPFSVGINNVMSLFAKNEAVFTSDIFDAMKDNFKQSMIIFLVNIIVVYVFTVNYKFYVVVQAGNTALKILLYITFFVFLIMNMYVYQLMLNYKISVFKIYEKALMFTIILLPQNILLIILIALSGALIFSLNTILGYFLAGVVAFSFISLLLNVYVHYTIKKYSVS
ncbi:MAG: DUF624 domain-containing protein [Ruminococcaceae bacterium]|nr:DUF624 domain-containing protein [Oscillospiraceae bacterium]